MYKAIKKSEIPSKSVPRGSVVKELLEFMETNYEAAEILIPENRTAGSVFNSYYMAVRRYGLPLRVSCQGGKVYMWKEGKK